MKKIVNVPLKVSMIGDTASHGYAIQQVYAENGGKLRHRDRVTSGLPVIELAGRGCYEAYKRPTPKTDSHSGYIENILRQRHYSVIEHVSVSFYIEGISRAETHELVRHRHFSFSQQSQRFCIVKEPYEVALHPTLLEHHEEDALLAALEPQFVAAEAVYNKLRDEGLGRKQASEAARAFLPNAAATHLVMTGNLRSWLEFISKRDHPAADRGIRRLAQAIQEELTYTFPEIFSTEARKIWDLENAQGEINHDK